MSSATILYVTRCLTGSQWSDLRSGLVSVRPLLWQTTLLCGSALTAVHQKSRLVVLEAWPWPRGSSRTPHEGLGLDLGLGTSGLDNKTAKVAASAHILATLKSVYFNMLQCGLDLPQWNSTRTVSRCNETLPEWSLNSNLNRNIP